MLSASSSRHRPPGPVAGVDMNTMHPLCALFMNGPVRTKVLTRR
jgi:hypothetical protein